MSPTTGIYLRYLNIMKQKCWILMQLSALTVSNMKAELSRQQVIASLKGNTKLQKWWESYSHPNWQSGNVKTTSEVQKHTKASNAQVQKPTKHIRKCSGSIHANLNAPGTKPKALYDSKLSLWSATIHTYADQCYGHEFPAWSSELAQTLLVGTANIKDNLIRPVPYKRSSVL